MVQNSFDYIANNNTVQEELESDEPYKSDGTELYSYYSRSGQIRRLLLQGYTSIYMNDIQLYGYNGANHLLANNHEINEETAQASCELAEQANGRCTYYNASEEGLMYMAKQIKDALTMEPLGILRASIKLSYLKKMTVTARESLSAHIFLLDSDRNILLESAENDGIIEDRSWLKKISGNTGDFRLSADGQDYNCVYQRSSDTGLTVVGMIPMSFLQKTARGLQKTTIMLILVSIILCIFLANILAKVIAGPIERTSNAMKKFAGGDFSVRLPEGRTDEIGAMNSVFNQTIEKIEQLLKQVVEMETVNKDIEFQALQAQINPHFLYNTMDMINWLAQQGRADEVSRAVQSLSRFYKLTLSRKQSISTIAREAEHADIYIQIQNMRYHDGITFVSDIPDELMEYQIPKLTLQPIIENSVLHGILETADKTGTIVLTGWLEDSDIVLLISDDGIGIPPEKLSTILSGEGVSSSSRGNNIAVYNTHRRLQILYGSDYGLTYSSSPDHGTEVEIRIPAKKA